MATKKTTQVNGKLVGTDSADILEIRHASNTVLAQGGADKITVYAGGSHKIYGRYGGDTVTITAGAGDGITVYGDVPDDIPGSAGSAIDSRDTVIVNGGNSHKIYGGAAADTITLQTTVGNGNYVYGGSGADDIKVYGGKQHKIYGDQGPDTILLGSELNEYEQKSGVKSEVLVDAGTGQDSITVNGGSGHTIAGGAGPDTITVNKTAGNAIKIDGGTGEDTIEVDGGTGHTIAGGQARDTITIRSGSGYTVDGGSAVDTITLENVTNSKVAGGSEKDFITVNGGSGVNLYGGSGDDVITVNGGDRHKIYGEIGNDVIRVTGTNIQAYGGAGQDTFVYANGEGNDIIKDYEEGQDTLEISSGSISRTRLSGTGVIFTVGNGSVTVENGSGKAIGLKDSRGSYTASDTAIELGTDFRGDMDANVYLSTVTSIDGKNAKGMVNITGNSRNNVIYAGKSGGTINGGTGTDTLYGGVGNDTLYGGSGSDTLNGGAGDDALYGEGGNNTLNGDAGNDTLYGGDGNGTLNGGAGDDILYGGKYPDTFIYTAGGGNDIIKDFNNNGQPDTLQITNGHITKTEVAGDNVIFTVGSGSVTLDGTKGQTIKIIDSNGTHKVTEEEITLYSDYTGTLDATGYFDTVTKIGVYTAAKGVTIIGNVQNNTIYDGNDSDIIYGGAGDDTVYGYEGDDTLYGDAGVDALFGGAGDDSLYGGDGDDHLQGDADDDTLYGEAGNDELFGGNGNDELYGGDGNDELYGREGDDNLYGGDGDDYLQGDEGNDALYGSTGNDTLYGGAGNDTFVFDKDYTGNNTIQNYEEGNDVVRFADDMHITGFAFNTETNNAIALDLSTGGTVNLTSIYGKTIAFKEHNDGDFALAIGTFSNDALTGSSGDDILYGLSGADTLNGNAGNDTLYGCTGKDTFIYGAGEGNDIIKDYVQNEDTLTITNGLISKTETDAGNLVFTAGSGTVTLEGAADKIISMTDTNGSYTVSAETITLGSDYSGTLNSNAYLSTVVTIDGSSAAGGLGIIGNSQNNVISGGAGNDVLTGGAGNDTFVYTGGDDSVTDYMERQDILQVPGGSISGMSVTNNNKDVVFTVDEGRVTLQNAAHKELSLKDENGSFTVSGSTITLGSDFTGSLNADIFSADTIYVGDCKGSVLTGGQGTDNFIFVNPTGNHVIADYEYGTDVLRFETDTVTGSAVSGTDVVLTLSGGATVTVKNRATQGVSFTDATNTVLFQNPKITQQSVIKSFMKGLDDSTLLINDGNGVTAGLDQVIQYASNNFYTSWIGLVNDLADKVQSFGAENSTQAKAFLNKHCGIVLDNEDTGAITGLDAGGPTAKTAESIVPEQDIPPVFPTSETTTVNGLTFHWGDPVDDLEIAVIKGLNTWWAEEGLNLIEESYGLSFTEEGVGTTDITVEFEYKAPEPNKSGTLAYVTWNLPESGPSTELCLTVNKYYVSDQLLTQNDGVGSQGAEYLDRTIVHELTHAVMAANIEGLSHLPDCLVEGSAELVHGIDDVRTSEITGLAYASSSSYLAKWLPNRLLDNHEPGEPNDFREKYSAGYMALRYFAKQVADYWNGDSMSQSNGMLASSLTDNSESILDMASIQTALLDFSHPDISESLSGIQRDESKNESLFITGNV